jgi:uncharacterized protein (DUF2235 family)
MKAIIPDTQTRKRHDKKKKKKKRERNLQANFLDEHRKKFSVKYLQTELNIKKIKFNARMVQHIQISECSTTYKQKHKNYMTISVRYRKKAFYKT